MNQAVREMVIGSFGDAKWEAIRDEAGSDDVFVSMDQYPDEVTLGLVGAACKVLGAGPADVMQTFGRFWVTFTSRAYGQLFQMSGNTFVSFVQNLNNLHTRVGQMLPELKPPSFTVTNLTDESFTLHYRSARPGLYPMVIGLMEGLGKLFSTEVKVRYLRGVAEGLDHDELLVEYRRA